VVDELTLRNNKHRRVKETCYLSNGPLGVAMGTRRQGGTITTICGSTPGNAFYDQLNAILDAHKFGRRVEHLCRKFYQSQYGRPGISPGVYFRSLLIGYFEGLDAERGIAWRNADSLPPRTFL
jgi:transposase